MPIYEYQCVNCGHEAEFIQKMSDDPITLCKNCDTDGLNKLISAPNFRLKGSGWYETDFKSDKEKKKNLIDKDEKKPSNKSEASSPKKEKVVPKVDTTTNTGSTETK